ncbi:MAG: glucose-6-phosphate dehydrogenase [Candidatus Paceibacter sp.]|jgi:glucose-6-phosphate 1-dehydrogenase|nr:glucose-6-phosphate dehydrogenase [Candidatus Paceibacter sp.]
MIQPFVFTLFGSTGDLAQKKIMPAIFRLYIEDRLPKDFAIIAFSRRPWKDKAYHDFIKPSLETIADDEKLEAFLHHVFYAEGHFVEQASFQLLQKKITQLKHGLSTAQKFFYLSVQPEFYKNILVGLSDAGLLKEPSARMLVEKPFGHSEASARDLQSEFEKSIQADQLFRVDHYLAKEGLMNVVAMKKNDPLFEDVLSAEHIRSIHIRILEKIGIEGRGEFYERIGAIMDVGQNHAMAMLAMLMMDPKKDENDARAEVVDSLMLVGTPILGQYEGYTNEYEVAPDSHIETYFKLEFESSLPRWKGTQIILEGGKALAEKKSDIILSLKDNSKKVFDINVIIHSRDAYEILIEEALLGNDDYFVSLPEVLGAWHALEPILKNRATLELKYYPKGTNGPTL